MLDMYTTDGKFAFQFEDAQELTENWDDYGLEGRPDDLAHAEDSVLVVLTPSGQGGWHHRRAITADELEQALALTGLLPPSRG